MESQAMEAKVVLLGSQGVGKTSLVLRFVQQTYKHETRPTIGASFLTKRVNVGDKVVKLQIWDTAGQERFRSMAPIYYRGAQSAVLVFDITTQESFNDVQNWVSELNQNSTSEYLLHIVGNKSDLTSIRGVTRKKAQDYATSLGATYFETSAKEDVGLNDLFLDITKKLLERKMSQNQQHSKPTQVKPQDPGLKKPDENPCC